MKSDPSIDTNLHEAKRGLYTFTGLNGELPNEMVPIWQRPLDWDFVSKHLWRMPRADDPDSWMGEFRRRDLRKGKGYHVVTLAEILRQLPSPLTKDIQPFLVCEAEVRGASKRIGQKRLFASARIVRVAGLFDQVSIAFGVADIWERAFKIGATPDESTHRRATVRAVLDSVADKIKGRKLRAAYAKPDVIVAAVKAAHDLADGRIGHEEFEAVWKAGEAHWQSLDWPLFRFALILGVGLELFVFGIGGLLGLLARGLFGLMENWSTTWVVLAGAAVAAAVHGVWAFAQDPGRALHLRYNHMLLARASKRLQYFLDDEARWDEIRQKGWPHEKALADEDADRWEAARASSAREIFEHARLHRSRRNITPGSTAILTAHRTFGDHDEAGF